MIVRRASPADLPRALEIWRAAVDATHQFLSPADRAEIDVLVAEQFLPNVEVFLVCDVAATLGFLVMDGDMIDALFVDPKFHGRGAGTFLVNHALSIEATARVDANEQASNALPFYLSRGFKIIGRSDTDSMGRPYPVIHLIFSGATPASKTASE